MLEHNFASIRYRDYHIFAGCYPNDTLTQAAVRAAAARFPNVRIWRCARMTGRPPRQTA